MLNARFIILFILVTILLASGFLLWSSKTWKPNFELTNMLPKDIDMRINNLTLTEAGVDNRSMTINASSVKYIKSQDIFILNKIEANIIDGESTYLITAKNGTFKQKEKYITLVDDVIAVDNEQRELKTGKIEFDLLNGDLRSESEFTLIGPEIRLSGNKFAINTKEKKINVEGRVNLLIN